MKKNLHYISFASLYLFLFFAICCLNPLAAQRATDVKFTLSPDQTKIDVSYHISSVSDELNYSSSLWLSLDGGATFIGPLKYVTGDVNQLKLLPTGKLNISWDIYKDVDELVGKVAFQVRIETQKIPIKPTRFWMYQFTPTAPLGFMYGVRKYRGGYGKIQTNLGFHQADYKADGRGLTNYSGDGYWVIGEKDKKSSLFVTGGYLHKIKPSIFCYAGLGFGMNRLYWDYKSFSADDAPDKSGYVLVADNSYIGLATEFGLIYFVKNKYPVSFGVQNINFGYWTISTGLGYKF
jgi:hypothetical protein